MNLCKYRNMFGSPSKGVHKYRLFDVAIVDVVFTLLAAALVTYFTNIPFWMSSIAFFLLGIFFHYLFCVNTTVSKLLNYIYIFLFNVIARKL